MPTKFIIVRHGQSMANVEKIYAAHINTPLSKLGRTQAELVGEYLKDTPIDAIYSSSLQRAIDTAAPTAESHGLEIIGRDELREIFGGEWEGKKFDDLIKEYPEEYGVWLNDVGKSRATGGESMAEVSARMNGEIDRIAALHPNQTVLIASHAAAIRTVCARALGIPVERLREVDWVRNASISTFLYEDGKLMVERLNDTAHLKGLESSLPANV